MLISVQFTFDELEQLLGEWELYQPERQQSLSDPFEIHLEHLDNIETERGLSSEENQKVVVPTVPITGPPTVPQMPAGEESSPAKHARKKQPLPEECVCDMPKRPELSDLTKIRYNPDMGRLGPNCTEYGTATGARGVVCLSGKEYSGPTRREFGRHTGTDVPAVLHELYVENESQGGRRSMSIYAVKLYRLHHGGICEDVDAFWCRQCGRFRLGESWERLTEEERKGNRKCVAYNRLRHNTCCASVMDRIAQKKAVGKKLEIFGKKLGQGASGSVFRAQLGQRHVAIKKSHPDNVLAHRQLEHEAAILKELAGQPGVVQLIEAWSAGSQMHVAMELGSHDLLTEIEQYEGPIPEQTVEEWMYALVKAVHGCHHLGIAHIDIKPENILFMTDGRLKLCDFGSSCRFIAPDGRARVNGGTTMYMAPERFQQNKELPTIKVGAYLAATPLDWWSCGIILFILTHKRLPQAELPWEHAHESDHGYNQYAQGKHCWQPAVNSSTLLLMLGTLLDVECNHRARAPFSLASSNTTQPEQLTLGDGNWSRI